MAALPLSAQVFAILSHLVQERSGLHYGPDNLELFAEKVGGPAIEAGFESLLDYYYYLRYDPAGEQALEKLIQNLLVHETYFFREADSLRVLVAHVIGPLVKSGQKARIWCAACATGEEPLTLAMLLDEAQLLGRVELVASDYSSAAVGRARRGEYGRRSLRALPPGVENRWLDIEGEDVARVRPLLREQIDWRCINLLDGDAISALGQFDVILCRNVLIYFDDPTVRRVIGSLSAALRPGGRVVVGVSESLLRYGTELSCEERAGCFFYRRAS